MKFCRYLYEYLFLDHYNGNIFLCGWIDLDKACIGNIFEDKIEDCYNGERANFLRSTMDDQTFRYCRQEGCPFLQNDELEEVTPEEYERRKKASYTPQIFDLAYDFICNQSCETCRKTVFVPPEGYAQKMSAIHKAIAPYLDNAKQITICGHGEVFVSPYMMDVLSKLNPVNPETLILLETNGVFFDEAHWERIKHLSKYNLSVVITINSFDPFTYRHISRGGNYEKLLHNLEFVSELRREGKISTLNSAFVIQDRNFRELPSFIKRSFDPPYAFDGVMLRPVYQWGTMDESVAWFKDVLNPLHPYHPEYREIMQDPILHDPRVYNFGGSEIPVHDARPYPGPENGLLPSCIPQNSRIVVYGAGQVGRALMEQLKQSCFCEVVAWVGRHFDGQCVMSPDILRDMPQDAYDAVVVATTNPTFDEEIRCNLLNMGVSAEQIVSCCKGDKEDDRGC